MAERLCVQVEGAHPPDLPFLFERARGRIAPAAVASATWHLACGLAIVLLVRAPSPDGAHLPGVLDHPLARLTWFEQPGPGGGGGGGGNHLQQPPRRVEMPGADPITVPAAQPRSFESNDTTIEPNPIATLEIPLAPLASAHESLPGVIDGPPSPPGPSQGRGSGPGAGIGRGSGNGPGDGPGLGDGRGGNTGGNVYQPGNGVTRPRLLREVKPQYTADAMHAKVQGTVLVACVVRSDGTVGETHVLRSLDPIFGLDQEAIVAVKQWRFAPGLRMGEPVSVQITIELTFTLR
jgi:periplasmic protein TonB